MFANIAQHQLRPAAASPLVSAGNPQPVTPPAFPFPSPLLLPRFDPPLRARMAIGAEVVRSPGARVDIGALESTSGSAAPLPMHGAQPLIPPRSDERRVGNAGVSTCRSRGSPNH